MGLNPGNMQKMMKQMQKMQADMAKAQDELANERLTVETGGVVTAIFNGHGEMQSIQIAPEAVDPEDVGMLEDLILAAVREGQKKSQDLAADRMGQITGRLNIPGMPGLF
ncbi:MAG: YbaB/EbfC family nucleoid-associated protein [Thermaerobacter sp.]|nr:YbaB/EbfC family nucleoid-associated protein [Thermaerobacter sp.]